MISIVVSTADEKNINDFSDNISKSIGCAFEIIVVSNPDKKFGLAEAYNIGGNRAKFPFLCFVHDDVRIKTIGWGAIVMNELSNPKVGLLALAGGIAKTEIPGDWSGNSKFVEIHIVQHYKYVKKDAQLIKIQYSGLNPAPVTIVDGAWICVRKELFSQSPFDSKSFPGFHGYDIDYSLQIAQSHQNLVTFDVLAEHFSEGFYSGEWLETAYKICEKWHTILPFSYTKQTREFWTQLNRQNIIEFSQTLSRNEFSFMRALKVGYNSVLRRNFDLSAFLYLFLRLLFYKLKVFISIADTLWSNIKKPKT